MIEIRNSEEPSKDDQEKDKANYELKNKRPQIARGSLFYTRGSQSFRQRGASSNPWFFPNKRDPYPTEEKSL